MAVASSQDVHYIIAIEVIKVTKDKPGQYDKSEPKRVRSELGKFVVRNQDLETVQTQAKNAIDLVMDGNYVE